MVIFGLWVATLEEFALRESYPTDKFEELRKELSRKFQSRVSRDQIPNPDKPEKWSHAKTKGQKRIILPTMTI